MPVQLEEVVLANMVVVTLSILLMQEDGVLAAEARGLPCLIRRDGGEQLSTRLTLHHHQDQDGNQDTDQTDLQAIKGDSTR